MNILYIYVTKQASQWARQTGKATIIITLTKQNITASQTGGMTWEKAEL